jgi:hypothetical protein
LISTVVAPWSIIARRRGRFAAASVASSAARVAPRCANASTRGDVRVRRAFEPLLDSPARFPA